MMTFQRLTALKVILLVRRAGRRRRCRRRLRSQPRAGTLRRPDAPGSTSSSPAKAISRSAICCGRSSAAATWRHSPACPIGRTTAAAAQPDAAGEPSRRRDAPPNRVGPRARRATRSSAADRHRGDLARLHLRLQLLLDHRNARPQLPHLVGRARHCRHRRRQGPRRARHLPRRRQHHAERRAVQAALPTPSSTPASTTSTTSCRP